jgi:glucokinase-like ROK family protein
MTKEISHRKTHTRAGNARLISELNKVNITNLVRDNDGISRADLAKRSGLSAPTISRIIDGLLREGLVTEIGAGVSHGGRKPTLLRFSGVDSYIIGIDLGTTNIYGVLTDLDANVIAEIRTPTLVDRGFDRVMERTSEVIAELRGHLGKRKGRIFGVGLAIAGLINRDRDIVEFSPDFHWHDVDVRAALSRSHSDVPIIFDNVTRVMALGEIWYGAGRNYQDFVMVNVGYGIGAGVIIRGTPLYGSLGMAGEFGHITFEKDSDAQCECGNFGCLEALASGNAIAKAARKELERGAESDLLKACDGDPSRLTAEIVAQSAKRGDRVARKVFDLAAEYIGVGIAGLINLVNPEAVFIGGGVSQAGDILFDRVRRTVQARGLKKTSGTVPILPATFGLRSAVMGAVSLILSSVVNLNFERKADDLPPNIVPALE